MARRMMLLALESLHALEARHDRLGGHARREHQLLRPQGDLLAVAIEDDGPLFLLWVEARAFGCRLGPVVQLHYLGIHFQPVADLVLRREHRPVLGEVDIGEMVVPDRIVQAERLIALAPRIPGALVLLYDDRGHSELPEARAKADSALAAADDQHIGLRLIAELLGLLVPQFLPGLGAGIDAMPRAEHASEARLLFMALELGHRGQQGPDGAVLKADQSIAPRDLGLERNPGFEDAARFRRRLTLGDAPVARLHPLEAMAKHVADLIAPFHCLDVPGERDEVAPVAVLAEHCRRGVEVARGQGGVEFGEEGRHTGIRDCVEHWYTTDGFDRALAAAIR